jgi:2-amino-4-hydroxy-6-hydroxymethyldihydropteridine diphosphokinase
VIAAAASTTTPPAAPPHWVPAYVALGSNLDQPQLQVDRAFAELGTLPHTRLVLRSALYRSRPMGPVTQPDFVNAVAGLLTQLDARTLLQHLKALEVTLGRAAPVVRWGPRLIDLDLLVHGATRIAEPEMTVPHPGLAERAFVLLPLADIAPSLEVPGVGTVSVLLQRVDTGVLEQIKNS